MKKYYVFENDEQLGEYRNVHDAMEGMKAFSMDAILCTKEYDEYHSYEYCIADEKGNVFNKITITCEEVLG